MENQIDETKFKTLYQTWGPMVLRRARFLLRDEDLAVDAMQETFMKVLRSSRPLDLTQPASLLWRMATQVCLNLIRSKSRRRENDDGDILEQIATEGNFEEHTATKDEVDRLFQSEHETTKVMAVLHFVDDWTLEAVAKEMGLSVSGVRKRLQGLKDRARLGPRPSPHTHPVAAL